MSQFKKRLISSTSRRTVLKGLGVGAASLAMPNIARAQAGTIKIGYVTPATGAMALFGETDGYTVEKINALLADGLEVNGERYNVEILVQDSQSDSNRSAEVSGDLILNEEVNLLIPASTTPTITAAADQAELYEIPCVSCGAPWQAIIFPRGGADNPFTWTYHFFWGLDEALRTFVGLWNTIETNKKVGMARPGATRITVCRLQLAKRASRSSSPATSSRARTTSLHRSPPSRTKAATSSAALRSPTISRPSSTSATSRDTIRVP